LAGSEAKPAAGSAAAQRAAAQFEYHLLLLVTLGLVAFGLIMVYSASSGTAVYQGADPVGALVKQGVWAVIGVGMLAFAARFPYRRWRFFAAPLLFVVIGLLLAVMVPGVGAQINGARRWILIGPISLQPSEFAKGAVLLFSCAVLAGRRTPPRTIKQLLSPVGLVALLVCALVVKEPDLGTAIAIAIMVCGVLLVAGTPYRLFLTSAGVLGAAAALLIYLEPYRRVRLLAFLNPWKDPAGAGYQNVQALLALGHGGVWGVGLGNGTLKIGSVPEASSDMIGAVIGEELGLVGIIATALAFAVFAFLGFRIALRCRDPFGRYLVAGGTALIAGQAFVNFGAVLGFLPLTGVPLPLISSGGSSLVVMLAIVGVMLNVADSQRTAATRSQRKADADRSEPPKRATAARADSGRRHGGTRRSGAGSRKRAAS
jgi:cell division protein FtsW